MAERIRTLRLKQGLTQEELGKVIGVQKSAIRKYESGMVENIPRSSIKKMADHFGVTPSYLMGWDDEPKKEYPPIPDGLTEDERFWVEIYRKVSPEIQDLLITMVSSFDQQSEDARQMLLRLIRAALGNPSL
jgi:transcriptional regulator with XRE-family HTH domain